MAIANCKQKSALKSIYNRSNLNDKAAVRSKTKYTLGCTEHNQRQLTFCDFCSAETGRLGLSMDSSFRSSRFTNF